MVVTLVFFSGNGVPRELHGPYHSVPSRRSAELVEDCRLPRDLGEFRVEDVADLAVDVGADGTLVDADLRCGDPCTAGQPDGGEQVFDESPGGWVPRRDRKSTRLNSSH